MINLSTNAKLAILTPNNNKALLEAIKQATPQQLEALKENKDLKGLLSSLFNDKLTSSKSDHILIELLKNTPVFKNMDSVANELKSLLAGVKNSPELSNTLPVVEKFLKHINDISATVLKKQLANSGVFMESKILQALHETPALLASTLDDAMKEDLKSNLLKLSEALQTNDSAKATQLLEHTNRILLQIDYHQLLSHLDASNSIYFPFEWDLLDKGSLAFKKKGEKKCYCEINLQLKEHGSLDLMMGLYDNNQLDIHILTQTKELKTLIQDNISDLRNAILAAGLNPRGVRIFEANEQQNSSNNKYETVSIDSDFIFEAKG